MSTKKVIEIFPMGKQEVDKSVQRAEKQNKMNANLRERNVTVSLIMFYLADEQNIHFEWTYHILYLVNKNLSCRIAVYFALFNIFKLPGKNLLRGIFKQLIMSWFVILLNLLSSSVSLCFENAQPQTQSGCVSKSVRRIHMRKQKAVTISHM